MIEMDCICEIKRLNEIDIENFIKNSKDLVIVIMVSHGK